MRYVTRDLGTIMMLISIWQDQPIYGDAACHQWGWINVKGKEANDLVPNKFTMVNGKLRRIESEILV